MKAKEQAEKALVDMRRAAGAYYAAAVGTGCHTFIEFTGLINEYITVCTQMTANGDYTWLNANTHTGVPLQLRKHNVIYLAEKLDCIYGPTLRADPELMDTLIPVKA